MKKLFLAAAFAALSLPAAALAPAPRPAAPAMPPEAEAAIQYLGAEFDARLNPGRKRRVRLDQPSQLPYTDEQQAAMRTVFGTDRIDIARLPAAGPRSQYLFTLPAHTYAFGGGAAAWGELPMRIELDAAARNMATSASWSGIDIGTPSGKAVLQGVTLAAKQTRDVSGLWLGNSSVTIASMHLAPAAAAAGQGMQVDGTAINVNITRQGKKIQVRHELLSKRISVMDEQVDDFHLAYRLRNLDPHTLAKFKVEALGAQPTGLPQAQRETASLKRTLALLRAMAEKGAVLELDDLSASYKGNTASAKGTLGMARQPGGESNTFDKLFRIVALRLEVRVPLALLQDVTRAIARKAPKVPGKHEATPEAIDELAKNMYNAALGHFVGKGYAVLADGRELRSAIEVGNGEIRVNGKALPPPAQPVRVPQRAPAPDQQQ